MFIKFQSLNNTQRIALTNTFKYTMVNCAHQGYVLEQAMWNEYYRQTGQYNKLIDLDEFYANRIKASAVNNTHDPY